MESPPTLRGKEHQQIEQLHSYLFRLWESLCMVLDGVGGQSISLISAGESPRAIFNSIKRLLCSSSELFDSANESLLPRFQALFLSLTEFRQFSTQQEEKFAAANEDLLDSESRLREEIDKVRQEIPALTDKISRYIEQSPWQGRVWESGRAELWAELDLSQSQHSLPISFSQALVFPQGSISGTVLTISPAELGGTGPFFITGKESQ
ncbi:MAG: hypothetical protein IJ364_09095 [Oscillospiraceae bacterium]|nr:hypothetical protein [Oscillospiraceae bacterium]